MDELINRLIITVNVVHIFVLDRDPNKQAGE